ncbi:hypothetical protein MMC07_006263, partial [Pseudocyphellaria aurata]|nr:hypothetical protein [Pseudocyphellaria aurata]
MPGIVSQDHGLPNSTGQETHQQTQPTSALPPTTAKPLPSLAMANTIEFIPSQMDALSSTTTEAARESPIRLLTQDIAVLVTKLQFLPWVLRPFWTSDPDAELYLSLRGMRDIVLQSWLFVLEMTALIFAIPAFLVLPGTMFLGMAAVFFTLICAVAWPMHGSKLVYSKMDEGTVTKAQQHEDERWIFVNGCMTTHTGLQNNVDRLSKIFGRAVIGVHNKSNGLIADVVECLIQRCFAYNTRDIRVTIDYVKACLADPTITKVILIGHSQGGIIISLALDYLFADLPATTISKLEIYTFASAASHFNNPRFGFNRDAPRYIQHIEHYCNEYDVVGQWGVLHNTKTVLDNRYSGGVFVRARATGHMLIQHYLNVMFPIPSAAATTYDGATADPHSFLDKVVAVDEKTATKRESAAQHKLGVLRRESGFEEFIISENEDDEGAVLKNGDAAAAAPDLRPQVLRQGQGGDDDGLGLGLGLGGGLPCANRVVWAGIGREARGKTTRELSRLWMYLDGNDPVDERKWRRGGAY